MKIGNVTKIFVIPACILIAEIVMGEIIMKERGMIRKKKLIGGLGCEWNDGKGNCAHNGIHISDGGCMSAEFEEGKKNVIQNICKRRTDIWGRCMLS